MERNVGYTPCYGADMKCLFQLLLYWQKDVEEVYTLLGRMWNCILSRRRLHRAETPECESLERWSMDEHDNKLRELMSAWNMQDCDKDLIWSLVRRSV